MENNSNPPKMEEGGFLYESNYSDQAASFGHSLADHILSAQEVIQ